VVQPSPSHPYGLICDPGSRDKPDFFVRRAASTYHVQPSDLREAVLGRPPAAQSYLHHQWTAAEVQHLAVEPRVPGAVLGPAGEQLVVECVGDALAGPRLHDHDFGEGEGPSPVLGGEPGLPRRAAP
jgi:hypothetical protein